jgi:pimeloyl-ACP methyl ester carboxylesterase
MAPLWKKKPVLGLGLGVGILGALALALRHQSRKSLREPIPNEISPTIFATRVADTSRGEMIYHICGTGEPIVFLHGFFLGASSYEWSKIYPQFANDREVIAPDWIGFGESERPEEAMDASDYADCLSELLRYVCPKRPAIIIASGVTCQVVLLLAARHPELVSRLVLFLPTRLQSSEQIRQLGLMANRIPGWSRFIYQNHIASPQFIRNWLVKSGFSPSQPPSEETVSILTTCARQYGAEHAIFGLMRNRKTFDASARVSQVLAPTHILWPSQAIGFDSSDATALTAQLPHADLEFLPEASLFEAMANPVEISKALFRWLDRDLISSSVA